MRGPRGSLLSIPPICAREAGSPPPATLTPLSFVPAEENQERMVIDPTSRDDPRFRELVKVRTSVLAGMFLGGQILGFRLLWARGAKLGAGQGALLLHLVGGCEG